jgi:outer membrane protein assembly factor BamB
MILRSVCGLALLAAVLSGLGGCDSVRTGANPEVPLWTHRPSRALEVVYKRRIVDRSRREGEPYERGQPEIDPVGRRLFVGSSDRGLYALRAEDGEVLWRFETLGFVQCAPLYEPQEDTVYFGSNDGALYKVAAADGRLLWRFATNAEVAERPVLSGGLLYVVNANDTVLALRPKSGELVWHRHRTPAAAMEVAGYSGPLVWRGLVYVGFSDGTVTAYDALTGAERWQPVDLSAEAEQWLGEIPEYLDADTTPLAGFVQGMPVVYVGSYAGGVFALDADTGSQVWSNPAVGGVTKLTAWSQPAHSRPDPAEPEVPERRLLIAGSGTTGLWGLDPDDGSDIWRRTVPAGGVSVPVPVEGALLVTASQLGVFLVSPTDGGLIDGLHTGDGVSTRPAVHGRRGFVVTNHGDLVSLLVGSPRPLPERAPRLF